MTRIELSEKFKSQLKKLKDEKLRDSIEKTLKDLLEDPNIGKPLRYSFKGFRVVKVYAIKHRKKVYK
jgi:mRNA-degrading endonuclease RelE of RelBE toxin-antitoxin system